MSHFALNITRNVFMMARNVFKKLNVQNTLLKRLANKKELMEHVCLIKKYVD